MKCVHAVEQDAGRAGAGERGGNFRADITGLADADDDDFATPAEGFADGVDGGIERFIELSAHGFECGEFDVEYLAGFGQMTHGARMRRVGR